MSFLTPLFLLAGLAAIAPILLHLLSREAGPVVPFPMVRFLRPTTVEQQRKRRPSDWLLLALRVLALLLLAVAFGRPFFQDPDALARTRGVVVAIDTSASMKAPATWTDAKQRALAAIDAAPATEGVAVIAFDDEVRVAQPLSADRATARAAVEALQPGAGRGSLDAAVRGALDVLASREGSITLISDLQRSGVPTAIEVPEGVTVSIAAVTPASTNLAVASVDGDATSIRATITNAGRDARNVTVAVTHDDREIGRPAVTVPGRGAATATLPTPLPRTGVLRVSVDDPGGLPDDNARLRVLDPAPAVPVTIVAGPERARDALFVDAALAAVDPAAPFAVETVTSDAFDAAALTRLRERRAVLILLSTRGMPASLHPSLAEWMRSADGRTLVAVGPDSEGGVLTELFGNATTLRVREADAVPLPTAIVAADVRHPVLTSLGDERSGLDATRVTRLVRLAGVDGGVVARFANGLPALVDTPIGDGRLMAFASDLSMQWNDLPRQPVMVGLMASMVRELGQRETRPAVARDEAGDRTRPRLVSSARGRDAVNVDSAESQLDVAAPAEVEAVIVRAGRQLGIAPAAIARETERAQSWWRVAVLVMATVLVIESVVGAVRRPAIATGEA